MSKTQANAVSILAEAFQDDPLMKWAVLDEVQRARLLPVMYDGLLRHCQLVGGTVFERTDGALASLPFKQYPCNTLDSLRARLWRLFRWPRATGRLIAHEAEAIALGRALFGEDRNYILAIGVRIAAQGRGIGARLLAEALAQLGTKSRPCVLKTETFKNVEYYQRHGFVLRGEQTIKSSRLTTWWFEQRF